jgi:N-methylhydantoinase A
LLRIGIDIGGAFTDLVAYDNSTQEIEWVKVESTPLDLSKGVIECVKKCGVSPNEIERIIHGQTVAINTIIERKGTKVGLLTTRGHRDVLEIQRANRRDMYNFRYQKPPSIVPRYLRIEVEERTMSNGTIIKQLNKSEVEEATRRLLNEGVCAICIAFINSYINPENERKAGDIVKNLCDLPIVLSHEVTREWREYERFSTAVLNAYILPILDKYLETLQKTITKSLQVCMAMTSDGGMFSFDFARRFPIYTVESGPVAGVIGAIGVASSIDVRDLIALDGGSTTTKASLVEGLTPEITTEYYIERDRFRAGLPIIVPVLRTVEIGNGGTSIAWVDNLGRIKVGPIAAGADPGPACYDKGGEKPTLTDAYVVTGMLNPKYLLGGELPIKKDLAFKSIKKIAESLGVSIEEAAEGIFKLANENAAYAIDLVSVQRGYDPRDFTLIAYGGSGPMFAPFIAEELEIEKIIIPFIPPGVFSAWGMLNTDVRHNAIITQITRMDLPDSLDILNNLFRQLEEEVRMMFESEGFSGVILVERYSDIRYYGQEHTVRIPIVGGELKGTDLKEILENFHQAHEREYEFKLLENPIEFVNFHLIGRKKVEKLELKELPTTSFSPKDAFVGQRKVRINDYHEMIDVYNRTKLCKGTYLKGPAIMEDPTATIILPHNQVASIDSFGNILIRRTNA